MGSQPTQLEIRRALDALEVDVPFYTAEGTKGGGVRFRLYGGRVVEWKPAKAKATSSFTVPVVLDPDDLTVIPGVGKGTAGTLKAAGLVSFDDLRGASDGALLQVVNAATLAKIRAYLREEYAQ